jgi:hypothetical protein
MHDHPSLRRTLGALAVAGALLLFAGPGRADPLLQISLADSPTIQSFDGTLTYNATTGEFRADTIPLIINSNNLPPGGGFFDLSMPGSATFDFFVNKSGHLLSNGIGYSLTGSVDLDGDGTNDVSGTLLTGTVVAFGSDPAGPPTRTFDGLFRITGGQLTSSMIPVSGGGTVDVGFRVGQLGGFFLFAEHVPPQGGTLANYNANFASDTVKDLEGVAVPAPPAVVLALLGAGLLVAARRGRRPPSGPMRPAIA